MEKDSNVLYLSFAYKNLLKEPQKIKIQELIRQKTPDFIRKIEIEYSKLYIDEEVLEKFLIQYLLNEHPFVRASIQRVNISDSGYGYGVEVLCDIGAKEYIEKFKVKSAVLDVLKNEFFESFKLDFTFKNVEYNEEPDISICEKSPEKIVLKVFEVGLLCGKTVLANRAFYIPEVDLSVSPCVICGKVSNIQKKSITKNNRTMFTFEITDYGGKMRCIYFAPSKYLSKFETLQKDSEIIASGNVQPDNYSGGICFLANTICLCKLPDKSKQNLTPQNRAGNNSYQTVFPQKVINIEQDSLFGKTYKPSVDLLNKVYVAFDIETTGLEVPPSKITEIGAIKIVNGIMVEKFSSLINPEVPIPEEITKLTKITDEMVKNKPTIEKVLPDFYKFTRGCTLIAHYVEFDIKFVRYFGKQQNYNFDNELMDTVILGREKVKNLSNYKLNTLSSALNINLENHHRAVDDAVACAEIFIRLNSEEIKQA